MLITFKSKVKHENQDAKIIEFTSELTRNEFNDFKVLEFIEPQDNVQNRIEYKEGEVIIFAGPTTMTLKLDEDVYVEYTMQNNLVHFVSHMNKLDISDNRIFFAYNLSFNNQKIGDYEIELLIKE